VILGGMIAVGVPLHKVLKKLKVASPSLFVYEISHTGHFNKHPVD
jgi:hypothetical protein